MAQKDAWEREYKNPLLVALGDNPQTDVKSFFKFLHKTKKVNLENLDVLDLGSGTGKNANYLAGLGNRVVGLEISPTAVAISKQRSADLKVSVDYRIFDIGQPYPFQDDSFDLVLDVMTSNALNEKERENYLKEVFRLLRSEGYFFFRGLCKDGDENAKALIKMSPGPEHDTYLNSAMGLIERVFTEKDFRDTYSPYFTILKLEKKTNYQRFQGRSYKRNYWIAYMQKKLG